MIFTTVSQVKTWLESRPRLDEYYIKLTQLDTDYLFSVWFSFRLVREKPPLRYFIPKNRRGPVRLADSLDGEWFWTFSRWHSLRFNLREFFIFLKAEAALLAGGSGES